MRLGLNKLIDRLPFCVDWREVYKLDARTPIKTPKPFICVKAIRWVARHFASVNELSQKHQRYVPYIRCEVSQNKQRCVPYIAFHTKHKSFKLCLDDIILGWDIRIEKILKKLKGQRKLK